MGSNWVYNSVKPQTIQEKVPAKSSEVRLYPNPNNGYFSIAFKHPPVDVTVAIHDIFGKIVYSAAATQKLVELQLPQLAQGIYFARISSRTINETFKIFKN